MCMCIYVSLHMTTFLNVKVCVRVYICLCVRVHEMCVCVHVRVTLAGGVHVCAGHDSGRTRACSLWFRRPTPHPLGHRAHVLQRKDHDGMVRAHIWPETDVGHGAVAPADVVGNIAHDPPRTQAWNLRLRRPTPYPLGQRASCRQISSPRRDRSPRGGWPNERW